MRAKFSYVLPGLLFMMFAVALTATAQDEMQGPGVTNLFAPDPAIYDDKPLLMEGEKTRTPVSIVADSIQHKAVPVPAAKKESRKQQPQAEGDPLNFNFLYYIIQKFKSSELMME